MRDAVRNKGRWKRRRSSTQDPSTDLRQDAIDAVLRQGQRHAEACECIVFGVSGCQPLFLLLWLNADCSLTALTTVIA